MVLRKVLCYCLFWVTRTLVWCVSIGVCVYSTGKWILTFSRECEYLENLISPWNNVMEKLHTTFRVYGNPMFISMSGTTGLRQRTFTGAVEVYGKMGVYFPQLQNWPTQTSIGFTSGFLISALMSFWTKHILCR